jgi:peptide deformylase
MAAFPDKLKIEFYRPELKGRPCRRVAQEDIASLPSFIEKMKALCKKQDAVGLAAPQVGVFIQLAILMTEPNKENIHVLVNPEITNLGGHDLLEPEGCLSIPPHQVARARLWRSEFAHVKMGTLENPDSENVVLFKGFTARVAQHEIDHLHGVFFIDRCQLIGRQIVMKLFSDYMQKKAKSEDATYQEQ